MNTVLAIFWILLSAAVIIGMIRSHRNYRAWLKAVGVWEKEVDAFAYEARRLITLTRTANIEFQTAIDSGDDELAKAKRIEYDGVVERYRANMQAWDDHRPIPK